MDIPKDMGELVALAQGYQVPMLEYTEGCRYNGSEEGGVLLLGVGGFLAMVWGSLAIFFPNLGNTKFIPLGVAAAMFCIGVIAFSVSMGLWSGDLHPAYRKHSAVPVPTSKSLEILKKAIDTECERVLKESGCSPLKEKMGKLLDQTGEIEEKWKARIKKDGELPHRVEALDKVKQERERLRASHDALSKHTAKIKAFYAECQREVDRMAGPLDDMELIRQTEEAVAGAKICVDAVEKSIAASLHLIATQSERMARGLLELGQHVAVRAAVRASNFTNDADLVVLESAVAAFGTKQVLFRE